MTGHQESRPRWDRLRVAAVGTAVAAVAVMAVPGVASAAGSASATSGSATQRLAGASAATVAGKTAKIGLRESVSVAGKSVQITGSGALDFVHKSSEVTLALPAGVGSVQVRVLGSTVYVMVPSQARAKLPGHTPWVSVNLRQASPAQLGSTFGMQGGSENPAQILGYLQDVTSSVTTVGTATVGGVSTTHVRAVIDLGKVAASQGGQSRHALQALRATNVPVDVYLDGQDRVRRIMLTLAVAAATGGQGGTVALTLNLSDFGAPVPISAPPAAQTTDITGLLLSKERQVTQMPVGGVATGGGSTAGLEDTGLLAAGVLLLLAGAGLGMLGYRRRAAPIRR